MKFLDITRSEKMRFSFHIRIGYIRTVSHHYLDSERPIELTKLCMEQSSTKKLDARDHRFLTIAVGIPNAHLLD
jgi:hypothetical protein